MSEWTLPEWRFRRGRHPKREDVNSALEAKIRFAERLQRPNIFYEERGRLARKMYLIERNLVSSNRVVMAHDLAAYLYWRSIRNGRI